MAKKQEGVVEARSADQPAYIPGIDLADLDRSLDMLQQMVPGVRGEREVTHPGGSAANPPKSPSDKNGGGVAEPREVWVAEVTGEQDIDLFASWIWNLYCLDPHSSAFLHRAYRDREQLLGEWIVGGSLLVMNVEAGDAPEIIGFGGIYGVDHRHRSAWLKFLIRRGVKLTGGAARMAVRRFAAYGMDRYGLKRLYMLVGEDNRSLEEILEKTGWEKCGCLPEYGSYRGDELAAGIYTIGAGELKRTCFGEDAADAGRGAE